MINKFFFRMFRANFRRYVLFFLSSSFTVMIFFSYMTILTNKTFMNPGIVNPYYSDMVIAPTFGITLFAIFFIFYVQASFEKFKKSEYGVLMMIGMTKTDIVRNIIFENSIIGFISIVSGGILGRIFSYIFYIICMKILDLNSISYTVSPESYLYTILFFAIIYTLVITFNSLIALKYSIINLLKSSRKGFGNILNSPIFAIIGISFIIVASVDISLNYGLDKNFVILRSIILYFIGVFLLISNIYFILSKILKLSPKKYIKNILFLSNIKYSIGQSKKILFLGVIFSSITIFFISIAALFIFNAQKSATEYAPYDIAFEEIENINKISQDELYNIVKSGDTEPSDDISVEYIGTGSVKIFSDLEIREKLGYNINVTSGCFKNLFQIVPDDGYLHDITEIDKINIFDITYICEDNIEKVLFNRLTSLNNSTLIIISSQDYLNIKQNKSNDIEVGQIRLLDFKDWRKTSVIADKLSQTLQNNNIKYNGNSFSANRIYELSSKIATYNKNIKGASFMLFLFVFIGLLSLFSFAAMIYFKMMIEFEDEKIKYKKIYRIGITKKELFSVISKELLILFIMPIILSIITVDIYIYFISANESLLSLLIASFIGFIYFVIQFVFYMVYKRYYIGKFNGIFYNHKV